MNGEPLKFKNLTKFDRPKNGDILFIRHDITPNTRFERNGVTGVDYWIDDGIEGIHPNSNIYGMKHIDMVYLLKNKGNKVTVRYGDASCNSIHLEECSGGFITTMFCKPNDDTKRLIQPK